jgi:hypothetical protein
VKIPKDEEAYFGIRVFNARIASVSLIVAEKFRALCSNLHDSALNPAPRPKDFYDLFAIYAVCFNRNPALKDLKEMKDLLQKCFDIKDMPLDLLTQLGSSEQKAFHAMNFQQQVLDTLEVDSKFKSITYDQAYSDALEFLDKIQAS